MALNLGLGLEKWVRTPRIFEYAVNLSCTASAAPV